MTTLLTIKDVATRLNVHPTTIHRMITRGELDAYRIGGTIRIETSTLDAYLDANRITNTPHRVTLRRQPSP